MPHRKVEFDFAYEDAAADEIVVKVTAFAYPGSPGGRDEPPSDPEVEIDKVCSADGLLIPSRVWESWPTERREHMEAVVLERAAIEDEDQKAGAVERKMDEQRGN